MVRKRRVRLLLLSALAACAGACDAFDFAGSKIEMTIANGRPTPSGSHVEVWGRIGDNGIVRLNPGPGVAYRVVQAVDRADPCMIDKATGHLLWKPEAQAGPSQAEKELQAEAVSRRIDLLTTLQAQPLYAFVSYDDSTPMRPTIADDAPAAERKAKCEAYWLSSPNAYTGNPLQLTAPIAGIMYGTLDFVATKPSQIAGGIQLISNYAMKDLTELWLTETPAQVGKVSPDVVDCATMADRCRGTTILQGFADRTWGQHVLHIDMAGPEGSAMRGAATVYINLDDDPVRF